MNRKAPSITHALKPQAQQAARFLKSLASPHRLLILCHLAGGEKDVTTLIQATGLAQTSMSQHLSKLKLEGLVTFRRQHRRLLYRISSPPALNIMAILHQTVCQELSQ
jgi:DNA-binding transcriptional ArsR family regulator